MENFKKHLLELEKDETDLVELKEKSFNTYIQWGSWGKIFVANIVLEMVVIFIVAVMVVIPHTIKYCLIAITLFVLYLLGSKLYHRKEVKNYEKCRMLLEKIRISKKTLYARQRAMSSLKCTRSLHHKIKKLYPKPKWFGL